LAGVDPATAADLLQHLEAGGLNMGLSEEEYGDLQAALLQVQQGSTTAAGRPSHAAGRYSQEVNERRWAPEVRASKEGLEQQQQQQQQPYVELQEVVVQPGADSRGPAAAAASAVIEEGSRWGQPVGRDESGHLGGQQSQQEVSWQQYQKHQGHDQWSQQLQQRDAHSDAYRQDEEQWGVNGPAGAGNSACMSPTEAREKLRRADRSCEPLSTPVQQHQSAAACNHSQGLQKQHLGKTPGLEGQGGVRTAEDACRSTYGGGGGVASQDEGLARGSLTGEKLRSLLCYLDSVEQEAEAEGRQGLLPTTGVTLQLPQ
jgi:hypothetical protein